MPTMPAQPVAPGLLPVAPDLTLPPMPGLKPGRLKRRAEFLRAAASGRKAAVGGVVLQALARPDTDPVRLGFTVTRKVGNAVVRNRTRRRLKEAARLVLAQRPVSGVDLVLIGRDSTRKRDFMVLQDDIRRALDRTGVS
jgi:ribonuclease P protein component